MLSVVVCDKFISFVVLLVSICQRLRASVDNSSFLEFPMEDFCKMLKGADTVARKENCKLLFAGCFVIPDLSALNISYRLTLFKSFPVCSRDFITLKGAF